MKHTLIGKAKKYQIIYADQTKCVDSKSIILPCRYAGCPDVCGVLTTNDMAMLGYIKCDKDSRHYLADANRGCVLYENK